MEGTQNKRFKVGEIKAGIISCILEKDGPISEPDIRTYLKDNYGIQAHGPINMHLHKLAEMGCVESIEPDKKSRYNYWDIQKIETLKIIRKEFSQIQLHQFEKSLVIVLFESGYDIAKFEGLRIYVHLLISRAFFDMYLETGSSTLNGNIRKLYTDVEDVSRYQRIEKILRLCHEAYLKQNATYEVSTETFLETIKRQTWIGFTQFHTFNFDEYYKKEFKEKLNVLPPELWVEIYKEEFSGIEDIPHEIKFNDFKKYMHVALQLLSKHQSDYKASKLYLLLKHCVSNDVLKDAVSPKELDFWSNEIENVSLYNKPKDLLIANLKQVAPIIAYYEQPKMFYKYGDSEADILERLLEYYNVK